MNLKRAIEILNEVEHNQCDYWTEEDIDLSAKIESFAVGIIEQPTGIVNPFGIKILGICKHYLTEYEAIAVASRYEREGDVE